MAKSKAGKRFMNMAYGLGAAIVILGALFKITHIEIGPLTGNVMLTIGLVVEALIFAISAFEPIDDEYDWSIVYPELAGGQGKAKSKKEEPKDVQGMLSQKLDGILKEAKIDANLMESLGSSIRNFEGAAKSIAPTADSIESQKKYSQEMVSAAANLSQLNSIYQSQLAATQQQNEANQAIAVNASKLKEQMESLASNLSSLNGVYGGMLSAMNKK